MIIIKYIFREVFKNQLIILGILFLVCFCQKFIKMLNLIVDDNIPVYLILICISVNMPELGKFVIPFSVCISVPITFYRLHIHNEILAMYSCAVNKYVFICSILLFSGIISVFSGINMAWLSPYCECYQNKLLSEIRKDVDLTMLTEKKFHSLNNKYLILFVNSIQTNKLKNIFLVRDNNEALSIILADQGNVDYLSNNAGRLITLKQGICYEIYNKRKLYEDIVVTKFFEYQVWIDRNIKILRKKNEFNYMFIHQLWDSFSKEAQIELHWRLTLLISIIIMPIIAALLFIMLAPNYFSCMVLMIFLYVIFFVLHILLRFNIFVEIINPVIWMWGVNILYFVIIGLLNLYDSFYVKKFFSKISEFIKV